MSEAPTITSLEFKCLSGIPDNCDLYAVGDIANGSIATGYLEELLDPNEKKTGRWLASFTGLEDESVNGNYILVVRSTTAVLLNEFYSIPVAAIGTTLQPWSEREPVEIADITSPGSGMHLVTFTIKQSNGTLIADCDVNITTSSAGPNTGYIATSRSNANGVVNFYLDEGTYYGWKQKAGITFSSNPFQFSVDDTGAVEIL